MCGVWSVGGLFHGTGGNMRGGLDSCLVIASCSNYALKNELTVKQLW